MRVRVECPRCGGAGQFRELASRPTTQPVELCVDEHGSLAYGEWYEYETEGDTEDEKLQCRQCYAEWPDLEALEAEMRVVQALDACWEFVHRLEMTSASETLLEMARTPAALLEPLDRRRREVVDA